MWELNCEKAECLRIDAFELWCWRRLMRIPWTARRSNQSILRETSPGCSLEGLMLRLKLQYFGHLMWRVDSLEKTLMLGGIGGRRRRGRQRMRWLNWTEPPPYLCSPCLRYFEVWRLILSLSYFSSWYSKTGNILRNMNSIILILCAFLLFMNLCKI